MTSLGVAALCVATLTHTAVTSGDGVSVVDRSAAANNATTDRAARRATVRVATGAEAVAVASSRKTRVSVTTGSTGLCNSS